MFHVFEVEGPYLFDHLHGNNRKSTASVKNVIITVFIPKEIPMTESFELRPQPNRTQKCVTDTLPKLKNLACLSVRLAKSKLI